MSFSTTPTGHMFTQSPLTAGGDATYIALGPTRCGKTTLVAEMITQHLQRDKQRYHNIVILSNTAKKSFDWSFLTKNHPHVYITKSSKHLQNCYNKIDEAFDKHVKEEKDKKPFLKNNRTLFVLDDFFGLMNASYQDSLIITIASQAAHLGITLLILTQKPEKLNDTLYDQACSIFNFCRGDDPIKKLIKDTGIKADREVVSGWSSKKYHFTWWLRNWSLDIGVPQLPILCKPIRKGQGIEIFNRRFLTTE